MHNVKKTVAAVISAALLASFAMPFASGAEENTMNVTIDGGSANLSENMRYRGAGMVSGNNSSRLMIDYKAKHPDEYRQLLNYIFTDNGIGVNHLKLEMGADINSSSGTEPSVKRSTDEKADVTRGAGYQLAADAKTVNPDLTLDMLWWSEPIWIDNSDDLYAARYQWYKETLDAAYETYGLKFDYVSSTQNEKGFDPEWVKYLAKALNSETDCPYDYSAIKLVAADEVEGWGIANHMLDDAELLEAVDVLGSHYTSWSSENAQKLAKEYGKELWFSEGCPPMSYAGTYKYDQTGGSGLNDINGLLDVANRFITMYPGGLMNLYEYQPVVAAYYDGVTYSHKQLITANEPWSGAYTLDAGFFMSLHFSKFIKKGWAFVDSACFADGVKGGDGHAIVDAKYSCITATDTVSGDYSTVITNTTAEPITYNLTVKNLAKAGNAVDVWETAGPSEGGAYNENYFKKINTITPEASGEEFIYSVTVKPYSLVTISTVSVEETEYVGKPSELMTLPYADDFEYADMGEGFLASRGSAPLYTTDEGGAFEVETTGGNNILTQKITPETKAKEWGGTPNPTTNFGDDRWLNYSASADVLLSKSDAPSDNYVGIGIRYNLGDAGMSGYSIHLGENGEWKLKRNKLVRASGFIEDFDAAAWHNLKVEAEGRNVRAYVDGNLVAEYDGTYTDKETGNVGVDSMLSAGRAALYSSYNINSFDNVKLEPLGEDYFIVRHDNTDANFSYSAEGWTHNTMSTFKNYKRTEAEATAEGASVTLSFEGTGFGVTGTVGKAGAHIAVKVDGAEVESDLTVEKTAFRETVYWVKGLEKGAHTAEITVLSGRVTIDAVEISGEKAEAEMISKVEEAVETTAETTVSEPSETAEQPEASETAEQTETTETAEASTEKKDDGFGIALPIGIGAAVVVGGGVAAGVIVSKKKKK